MRFQSPVATTPPVTPDGRITELHLWAVREGLRRAPAAAVFEDFCRRLAAAGVPLWRAFVGMRTLHPQWAGYTYTWWRDRDVVDPSPREHGEAYDQDLRESPYTYLRDTALGGGVPQRLRRRLAGGGARHDFAVLEQLAIAGGTDYLAELIPVGMATEAFPDSGLGFSFATDHPEGFSDDDLHLIEAVLPAVSLAIVSDAEHTMAAGLLAAYLGSDAGRRVHAGVVERGSVESIRAVLWYADIRGFTPIADATPGPVLVEMLDDIFETLAAPLRRHRGEVLKFLGDGMLASFAFVDATRDETCGHALNAATESSTLPGIVGYEWDAVVPGCVSPAPMALFHFTGPPATADAVRLTGPSGATVFSAGTLSFALGLDDFRPRPNLPATGDQRLEAFMRNALAALVRPAGPLAVRVSAISRGVRIVLRRAPDPRIVTVRVFRAHAHNPLAHGSRGMHFVCSTLGSGCVDPSAPRGRRVRYVIVVSDRWGSSTPFVTAALSG